MLPVATPVTKSVVLLLVMAGCASALPRAEPEQALAFPGAEGFGRHTVGGRGGRVIKVTNLGDNGAGSLRDAVQSNGPRTIIFEVAGIIDLERDLDIHKGDVTIAGQTAPGDGITLRHHGLNIMADQVIIRYLRVRPGDEAGVETDAISVKKGHDIIVDHCSTSWATDETLSVSPTSQQIKSIDNVTVQWSIISESLNRSVHTKGEHGYGSLIRGSGGARYSLHHNLWAHHRARMPRPGNYLGAATDPIGPLIDIRNNVFYNWGGSFSGYNADTESLARYNFVGNYYLAGPNSRNAGAFRESNLLASMFFDANFMDGKEITDAVTVVELPEGADLAASAHAVAPTVTDRADKAYERVLKEAGASLQRDTVDSRIVANVRSKSGRIIDDEADVGGWPEYASGEAPIDRDNDGMPDVWEQQHGFDASDKTDGILDADSDGYTNLEEYLNSLVNVQ